MTRMSSFTAAINLIDGCSEMGFVYQIKCLEKHTSLLACVIVILQTYFFIYYPSHLEYINLFPIEVYHEFHETCNSVLVYLMKKDSKYIL